MRIDVQSNADQMREALTGLGRRVGERVLRNATNRTATALRKETQDMLRTRLALSGGLVRRNEAGRERIRLQRAGPQKPTATLFIGFRASEDTISLKRFPHRQNRRGVAVRVLREAGRKTIRSAFTSQQLGDHVFVRRGPKRKATKGRHAGRDYGRQQVVKLFGPSIRQQAEPILRKLSREGWVGDRMTKEVLEGAEKERRKGRA